MDGIRTRDIEGKQRPEYYNAYYIENKERIAKRFKERYERIKADPVLLEEHRRKCAEATRRWRERYAERVAGKSKLNHINRRKRAFEILGGTFCVKCGCDVFEFLEFNHKNGGGCKEYSVIGNHIVDKILNGQRNIDKYNVLCRVCNALDYLGQKNSEKAKRYTITFTGQKAVKLA